MTQLQLERLLGGCDATWNRNKCDRTPLVTHQMWPGHITARMVSEASLFG